MKMTVRACVLATVVILLGASSMFAQTVFDAGAAAGSPFNSATAYNFAVNREGVRELFSPVTICQPGAAGPLPAVGVAAPGLFVTGDVYRIRYYGVGAAGGSSPVLASGALSVGTQVTAFQNTVSAPALAATASATVVTIPGIGGQPPTTASEVDITITQGVPPSGVGGAGYPACITIAGLRFDVANTVIQATGAVVPVNSQFVAIADITVSNGASLVTPIPRGTPAGVLATGMPPVALACAVGALTDSGQLHDDCAVGLSGSTLSTAAITPVGGTTQGPTGATFTKTGGSIGVGALPTGIARANPGYVTNGVALTTNVPNLVQNSGATGTAVISVLQQAIPAGSNIDVRSGGGMLRSNASAGANAASWLIAAGATTGTQIEFAVAGMPTGSSVTFGNDASVANAVGTELMHMTLVGSGALTAPSGKATYVVTTNTTGGVATQIDIPYSVTVAGTGVGTGVATVIISVRPPATAGDVPRYIESSTGATGLTVTPNPTNTAVSNQFTLALYNVAPSTSTRLFPYLLKFGPAGNPVAFDSGIALCNTTGTLSSTGVFSPAAPNGSQIGTFTIDLFPSKDTTPSTPLQLKSDAAGFPGGATLTAGALAPGNCWQALLSEVLKAATPSVTGDWKGYARVTTTWNINSTGFAFISQFAQQGGSTMGYVAQ